MYGRKSFFLCLKMTHQFPYHHNKVPERYHRTKPRNKISLFHSKQSKWRTVFSKEEEGEEENHF